MDNELISNCQANQSPGKTVLIVEDHADTRILMSNFLQESGYRTIETFDGIDALKALDIEVPHIILTDLRMPNMDGLTLSRRLKSIQKFRHIPIILVSSTLPSNRALYAEFSSMIQKPYVKSALLESILRFL